MRAWLPVLAAAVAGCSNLSSDSGGVISLQVVRPEPAVVEVGDTITLTARALDRNGDSVAADIRWRAADTTLWVDSVLGRVTGRVAGQNGRVQASETSLTSNPITLAVVGPADTLAVPPDTLIVAADATTSSALVATVLSRSDTAVSGFVPASGARMTFEIVAPVFADPAARTVEFTGSALTASVVSGTDGTASPAVTLSRVTGQTAPDTVRVAVRTIHRSGAPVAGSEQQVLVLFQ